MSREETPLDRVLAALTAPAHPSELGGREKVLAAFREAAARPAPEIAPSPAPRRAKARLLTLRAGVAALCVVLLGGGVAVATGAGLPLPGGKKDAKSSPADRVPELSRKKAPAPAPSTARPTPSNSPDPGLAAVCRKIVREGKGRRWRPGPAESRDAAFAALVEAAGGPDRVHEYCRALWPKGPRPPGRPGDKPGKDAGPRDDRPQDRPSARPGRPDAPDRPRPGKP